MKKKSPLAPSRPQYYFIGGNHSHEVSPIGKRVEVQRETESRTPRPPDQIISVHQYPVAPSTLTVSVWGEGTWALWRLTWGWGGGLTAFTERVSTHSVGELQAPALLKQCPETWLMDSLSDECGAEPKPCSELHWAQMGKDHLQGHPAGKPHG